MKTDKTKQNQDAITPNNYNQFLPEECKNVPLKKIDLDKIKKEKLVYTTHTYNTAIGNVQVICDDYQIELSKYLEDNPDFIELDFVIVKLKEANTTYAIYVQTDPEKAAGNIVAYTSILKSMESEILLLKNRFKELAPLDHPFYNYIDTPSTGNKLTKGQLEREEKIQDEISQLFEVVEAYQKGGIEAAKNMIEDYSSTPVAFLKLNNKYPDFFSPKLREEVLPELIEKLAPSLTQTQLALNLYYRNKAGYLDNNDFNNEYFVKEGGKSFRKFFYYVNKSPWKNEYFNQRKRETTIDDLEKVIMTLAKYPNAQKAAINDLESLK